MAFLHPEFTIWALLELGSFHKEHEIFLFFTQIRYFLVLLAGHISMQKTSTPQAILFLTGWAVIIALSFISLKDGLTAWCGTPTYTLLFILNIFLKCKLFILFSDLLWKKLPYIINKYLYWTIFLRTGERKLSVNNLLLCILTETFLVEEVAATEIAELWSINIS